MLPFRDLEIEPDLLEIKDGSTGVAWPSSARVVGCSLQWGNERNPCPMLNIHRRLSTFSGRKRGRRQVSMALMARATHIIQWSRQRVAKW